MVANLTDADLTDVLFKDALASGANLTKVRLTNATLDYVDLADSKLAAHCYWLASWFDTVSLLHLD